MAPKVKLGVWLPKPPIVVSCAKESVHPCKCTASLWITIPPTPLTSLSCLSCPQNPASAQSNFTACSPPTSPELLFPRIRGPLCGWIQWALLQYLLSLLAASGLPDFAPFLQPAPLLASMTSFSLGFLLLRPLPVLRLLFLGSLLRRCCSWWFWVSPSLCPPHSLPGRIQCTSLALPAFCNLYPGDFQICVFSSCHSPELRTHLYNQILDLSTSRLFEPLKLHVSQTELTSLPLHWQYSWKPPHSGLCAINFTSRDCLSPAYGSAVWQPPHLAHSLQWLLLSSLLVDSPPFPTCMAAWPHALLDGSSLVINL